MAELGKRINNIEQKIEKLPSGYLVTSRTDKRYKWYHSDGHRKKYIPKSERAMAERLAQKNYLTSKLKRLQAEERALFKYVNEYENHIKNMTNPEDYLNEESAYYELLSPYHRKQSQIIEEWTKEDFERNTYRMENLKHRTSSGEIVRSKSESIIAKALWNHNIPFRYECVLELDSGKVYPDFTIMHPKTGHIYYWEHFGFMDDTVYVEKTCKKLKDYARNGIIPSHNLIVTFETEDSPLTEEMVELIIKYYFL